MDCCKRNISARISRVVLPKLLAAREANFLSLLVLAKKIAVLACSQRPFVTPNKVSFLSLPLISLSLFFHSA